MKVTRFHSGQQFPLERLLPVLTNRPFMYFFATLILIGGAYVESRIDREFFQRSGAVLVMAAILQVWLWFKYDAQRSLQKEMNEYVLREVGNQPNLTVDQILSLFDQTKSAIPTKSRRELAEFYGRVLKEGSAAERQLSAASYKLGRAQFELGFVGTLVWAFGDLAPF